MATIKESREASFAWAKYYKLQKQDSDYLNNLFYTARIIKQTNIKAFKIFIETIWNFVLIKEYRFKADKFYAGMSITSYNEETKLWTHTHPKTGEVMYETKKNNPHPATETRQVNRYDYVLDFDVENSDDRFIVNLDKYEKINTKSKSYYKLKV